jgi:small subunit ribosomal protein S16
MVRIRMNRMGRKNHPFYRIGVYNSLTRRDGKCIENLGWYDPFATTPEKQLSIRLDRAAYWLSVGAQPSPKTGVLLKKAGAASQPAGAASQPVATKTS